MKKRILSMVLALAMCLSLLPGAALAAAGGKCTDKVDPQTASFGANTLYNTTNKEEQFVSHSSNDDNYNYVLKNTPTVHTYTVDSTKITFEVLSGKFFIFESGYNYTKTTKANSNTQIRITLISEPGNERQLESLNFGTADIEFEGDTGWKQQNGTTEFKYCGIGFPDSAVVKFTNNLSVSKEAGFTLTHIQKSGAHDWGVPTYEWAADGSTCTAKRVCNNDTGHIETANAAVTSEQTKAPTYTEKGETTYTADFAGTAAESWAEKQTKVIADVEELPATWNEPTYEWGADNLSCTATRTCQELTVPDQTAEATVTSKVTTAVTCTAPGKTTYTATFTETWAAAQAKEVDIPALGHSWGEVTYTWSADNGTCTAKRVCTRDGSHIDSEEAAAASKVTPPSCVTRGETTYTVSFEADWATAQTKTVKVDADQKKAKFTAWEIYSQTTVEEETTNYDKGHTKKTCELNVPYTYTDAETGTKISVTFLEGGAHTNYNGYYDTYGLHIDGGSVLLLNLIDTPENERQLESFDFVKDADNLAVLESTDWKTSGATATYCGTGSPKSVKLSFPTGWSYGGNMVDGEFYITHSKAFEGTHDWGVPTYEWAADGSTCTAKRVCSNDTGHIETANAAVTSAQTKAPTYTEKGENTYTATFTESWAVKQTKVIADVDILPATWNDPTYEWASDGSTCTATRTCSSDPAVPDQTAEAAVTSEVTRAATCTAKGETTYTATFDGVDWAATQAKTIDDIAATGHDWNAPTYEWAENGSACTATRTCKNDPSHIETAAAAVSSAQTQAPTCTAKGETTYTATFDKAWAAMQTKTIADVDATGHSFGTEWKSDDTNHWHECSCGERSEQAAHSWDEGEVTKAATCTETGVKTYTCTVCGKTKTESMAAIGHNWNAPTYEWAENGSACTATRTCKNDPSHIETASGVITSQQTLAPTCTAKGETTYTAAFAGTAWATNQAKTVADINATGHQHTELRDTKAATCTEAGYTGDTWCADCNTKIASGTVVDALGHSWGETAYEWAVNGSSCTAKRTCTRDSSHTEAATATITHEQTLAPTCTVKGETTYTATFTEDWAAVQNKTITDIDATGHQNTDVRDAKAATCTEAGYTGDTWCTDCNTKIADGTSISALGHSWGETVYEWAANGSSCTAKRTCTRDGSHIETATATITNAQTKAPTTTEKGERTYTATFTEGWAVQQTKVLADVPMLEANWSEPVYQWAADHSSCTATRSCTNDSGVPDQTVTATAAVKQTRAPTCTAKGEMTYTATFEVSWAAEQTTTTEIAIDPTNHDWNEPAYEWASDGSTCTAKRICAHDSSHIETASADVSSKVTTPATCTVKGKTAYTATFSESWAADQTKVIEDIPATGHKHTEVRGAKAATCTETGYTGDTWCTDCNTKIADGTSISALGHSWGEPVYEWVANGSSCTAKRTCTRDDSHIETVTATITSAQTKAPTTTEKGERTYTATFTEGWAAQQTKVLADVPMLEANWSEPVYQWAADHSSCTATRSCTNDSGVPDQTVTATAAVKQTRAPTCTAKGEMTYTATFEVSWAAEQRVTVEIAINADAHDWEEVAYIWTDTSACTAKRVCKLNSTHVETAEATITSVTKAPTCTAAGETTYTAAFTEDWAKATSKTLADVPALGHTLIHNTRVEPQVGVAGMLEHWHCNTCGQNFADEQGTKPLVDLTITPLTPPSTHHRPDPKPPVTPEVPEAPETPNLDNVKPGETHTETKPDGTKVEASKDENGNTTVTETRPDGTKVESQESANGDKTVTETRKDGTTVKSEEKANGDKTITETKKDGSSVKSEEKANGDKAITETRKDGSSTKTEEKANGDKAVTETAKDGSSVKTEDRANGDEVVTKTDKNGASVSEGKKPDGTTAKSTTTAEGKTEVKVGISKKAVETAQKTNKPVEIPVAPVEATKNSKTAPVVQIELNTKAGDIKVSIPVEKPTAGTVAIIVHPDGTEEVVRKSALDETGLKVELENGATLKVVDNAKDFNDTKNHWAANAIDFATSRQLYAGTSATTFTPNSSMTRGMLAQVLYNLESNPETTAQGGFKDVSEDLWCNDAISWAADNGIVGGYTDGSFGTNDSITREQLAVMLYRYAGSPEHSGTALKFNDANVVSGYAADAMAWAVENGIIAGTGNNTLSPQGTATRAQVATMLMRFLNK